MSAGTLRTLTGRRQFWLNSRRVVAALAGTWVIFILLLLIPMAVPDDAVISRYEELVGITSVDRGLTPIGTESDGFTECIETLVGSGSDRVKAVLVGSYPRITDGKPCEQYQNAAMNGLLADQIADSTPYYRYWHGSIVVSRALFAYVGVEAVRNFTAATNILVLCFFFFVLARTSSVSVAFAFFVPIIYMSDASWLALSFPHAIGTSVAVTTAAITMISFRGSGKLFEYRWTIAAVSASFVAFVDLLNVLPVAAIIFLFSVLQGVSSSAREVNERPARWLKVGALAFGIWCLSFSATWAVKWLIALPYLGYDVVFQGLKSTGFNWSALDYGYASLLSIQRLQVGISTLPWWDQIPLGGWRPALGVLSLVLAILLVRLLAARGKRYWLIQSFSVLSVPAALFIVWSWAMPVHAVVHGLFIYRGWAYALGVVGAAAFVPLNYGVGRRLSSPTWARGGR